MRHLQAHIEAIWERRATLPQSCTADDREAIAQVLTRLDRGEIRVAEKTTDTWVTHPWIKQAVLLSFRIADNQIVAQHGAPAFDKVALKCRDWEAADYLSAGFRQVPGAVVRHSAYIAPGAILMPCFVNVGAHVGKNSLIDAWATVGSCAQIGANCHISGGVGIGGVLEPLQADPVIIEDDCFIGARSEIAEGVLVEQGAVIAMGVFLGASTKIIDRATGDITVGRVPAYAVVVPGTLPGKPLPDGTPGPGLSCAVIVKKVDAQTRAKTAINDLLRG